MGSPCTRTSSALSKGPITARELAGMDIDVVKGIGEKKKDALEGFGISSVLLGTVVIAVVAVAIALPISMGTALFITEVAPRRLKSTLVALVDLMAAVPSVVYGLWGLFLLQGQIVGLSR